MDVSEFTIALADDNSVTLESEILNLKSSGGVLKHEGLLDDDSDTHTYKHLLQDAFRTAAEFGKVNCMKVLLKHFFRREQSSVDAGEGREDEQLAVFECMAEDAMYYVCASRHLEMFELLVEAGVDLAQSVNSPYPHHMGGSLWLRNSHDEVLDIFGQGLRQFFSLRPDLKVRTDGNHALLLLAVLLSDETELVRLLSEEDVDVNKGFCSKTLTNTLIQYKGFCNSTLLEIALNVSTNTAVITTLVGAGARPDDSSLIVATHRWDCKVIDCLIAAGANVNAVGQNEFETPLRLVVTGDMLPEEKLQGCLSLLKHGARVSLEMHVAIHEELTDIAEAMLDYGAMPRLYTLHQPGSDGDDIFYQYIPEALDETPVSPLFTAFLFGNSRLVNTFLKVGFLNEFDVRPPPMVLSEMEEYVTDLQCDGGLDRLAEFTEIYETPWSLQTLSFVRVSTQLGFDSDRREKLSRTGLPPKMQKQLMFEDLFQDRRPSFLSNSGGTSHEGGQCGDV